MLQLSALNVRNKNGGTFLSHWKPTLQKQPCSNNLISLISKRWAQPGDTCTHLSADPGQLRMQAHPHWDSSAPPDPAVA